MGQTSGLRSFFGAHTRGRALFSETVAGSRCEPSCRGCHGEVHM